jgi:hypothetical protein
MQEININLEFGVFFLSAAEHPPNMLWPALKDHCIRVFKLFPIAMRADGMV